MAWVSRCSASLLVSLHLCSYEAPSLTCAATLILLETAPIGFNNVGWKYYLLIICWSVFFIPGKFPIEIHSSGNQLIQFSVIYFFFPETARLTLEEIAKNFGEEVAVNLTDATDEEKAQLDHKLVQSGGEVPPTDESETSTKGEGLSTVQPAPMDEQNAPPKP